MKRKSKSYLTRGYCPNSECGAPLCVPSSESGCQCPSCGHEFERTALQNARQVSQAAAALGLWTLLSALEKEKQKERERKTSYEKVGGVSNFECKLLSPLLTTYGMDKAGSPILLAELLKGRGKPTFDCATLGDRCFVIDKSLSDHPSFGKDRSGSSVYLVDVLEAIQEANEGHESLIPVHVDGDGHCLVHAISRCLVGRELFWHALRTNMKDHLDSNLPKYKEALADFVSDSEWSQIIAEADADYTPPEGETKGLGNVHIFALSNVLRRPIILLDTPEVMKSSNGYSGVFLPALYKPEECCGKSEPSELNSPVVIAWSSMGHHHFVPLVAIKGQSPARFPRHVMPGVWGGFPQELLSEYITFDAEDDYCLVASGKCLSESYLIKLIKAMQQQFFTEHQVSSHLVAEMQEEVYRQRGFVQMDLDFLIQSTKAAVSDCRLCKCISCHILLETIVPADEQLLPGGTLYETVKARFGHLSPEQEYSFPYHGVKAKYNKSSDLLEVIPYPATCPYCRSGDYVRTVKGDGSVEYVHGDTLDKKAPNSKCCGFKHFYNGKEYDNQPVKIPINLDWGGEVKRDEILWFENESDPSLNSNAYTTAADLVDKNFPGEFGTEKLVYQVVETILRRTRKKAVEPVESVACQQRAVGEPQMDTASSAVSPSSKIILTGAKHKTIHKEELTKSSKEKEVKRRIEEKARIQQTKSGPLPKRPAKHRELPVRSSPASTQGPAHQKVKPSEKKVRVSLSDGRAESMTFPDHVTYSHLQEVIDQQFSIPPERQKIRHGFPPREIQPPENKDSPVALQHGDKLSVEILPQKRSIEMQESKRWSSMQAAPEESEEGLQTLVNTLLARIQSLGDVENWETKPELFEPGGMFFTAVKKDLPFRHGLHCRLYGIEGKMFALNLKANPHRLELCDSHKHRVVGDPDPEKGVPCTEKESHTSFGVVRMGEQASNVRAFSGAGHSLSASPQRKQAHMKKADVEANLKTLERRKKNMEETLERLEEDDDSDDEMETGESRVEKMRTDIASLSSEIKRVRKRIKEMEKEGERLH